MQLEKSAGGGKKDPEGHREKEAVKNKKKKHGSKMGKSGASRSEESAHVGAIGSALEPLARHWSHWLGIGAIGLALEPGGSKMSKGGACEKGLQGWELARLYSG